MIKRIKFYSLNFIILFIITVIWFLSSFLLGFANSSNHQIEIAILYLIAIIIHFIAILHLNKKYFNLKYFYIIINFIFYLLIAYLSCYYT